MLQNRSRACTKGAMVQIKNFRIEEPVGGEFACMVSHEADYRDFEGFCQGK